MLDITTSVNLSTLQLVDDWNIDAPSYKFDRLDPENPQDKETINKYFLWEGDFDGRDVLDGKVFK